MYTVCVTAFVTPGDGDRFLEEARRNHEGTRREPGNVRFDVLRAETPCAPGEPEQFFLYEAYQTADYFAAHQQTPHYLAFRDAVAPIMAQPRQPVRYVSVYVYPEPWE